MNALPTTPTTTTTTTTTTPMDNNKCNTILLQPEFFTPIKFVTLFKKETLDEEKEAVRRQVLIGGHQHFQVWDVVSQVMLLEGHADEKEVESFLRFDCFFDTVVGSTTLSQLKVWVVESGAPASEPAVLAQQNMVFGVHIDLVSIICADTKVSFFFLF